MALPTGGDSRSSAGAAERMALLERRLTGPLPNLGGPTGGGGGGGENSMPEDGGAAAFAAANAAALTKAAAGLAAQQAQQQAAGGLSFPRPPSASKREGGGGGSGIFRAVDTGGGSAAARGAPPRTAAGGTAAPSTAWRPVTSGDAAGGAVAGAEDASRSSWGGGGGGVGAAAGPLGRAGSTAADATAGGARRGKRKQPDPARRPGGGGGAPDDAGAPAGPGSARKAPRGPSASPQVGSARPSPSGGGGGVGGGGGGGGATGRRPGSATGAPPAAPGTAITGGGAAGIGGGGAPTTLLQFFNAADGGGSVPAPLPPVRPSPSAAQHNRPPSAPAPGALAAAAAAAAAAARREWAAREAELAGAAASARADAEAARAAAAATTAALDRERAGRAADTSAARACLAELATAAFKADRDLARARVRAEAPRLGGLRAAPRGSVGALHLGPAEVWEDGFAARDLDARAADLAAQRERVEAARKSVRARLPPPGHPLAAGGDGGNGNASNPGTATGSTAPLPPPSADASTSTSFITPDDYIARDEAFKARLAALKREEDALARDRALVEAEKVRHAAEVRRLGDEDASRFGGFPLLAGRYALGRMLGRGGFSEVFEAVDLAAAAAAAAGTATPAGTTTTAASTTTAAAAPPPPPHPLPRVAIKLHQLAPGWPDARKASYVRHAVREYSIHRGLRHERVVALREIFEVDSDAFATVLDHCPGGDLDAHLRTHGALPEREARAIAAQVFAGLAYLNAPPRRVIHYDLKPANILFDGAGGVKLTDFGLSKVVEDGHTRGLELTSQGAGTYWYLPPECFETGGPGPPLITNKVDVWAAGVILFQMLFGRRPWGEGRSQEALLRDGVMLTATRGLDFPARPAVSAEAKAFLAACLAYRQADRLDVHAAAAHPYLVLKRPGGGRGGGGGGG